MRQGLLVNLKNIPYGEVIKVEQELISEGLPEDEVFDLCDAHSAVLYGKVDLSASKSIPDGHPVDVLLLENNAFSKTRFYAEQLQKSPHFSKLLQLVE